MSKGTDLQPFRFEDHEIRFVIHNGEPHAVLVDACSVFGISNARDVASRFAGYVGQTDVTDSLGRARQTNVISEVGLYRLAFRSDKPEAERFADWAARVIREIRQTGSYSVSHPAVPQSFADALELAAKQAREIEQAQRTIGEQRKTLDWAEPRAQYVDAFVRGAEDATKVRDLAAQLGVQERAFRGWLITRKLAYKDSDGMWKAYAQPASSPRRHWFVLRDQPEAPRLHNDQMRQTLYVTPAGKAGIRDLLAKHPIT